MNANKFFETIGIGNYFDLKDAERKLTPTYGRGWKDELKAVMKDNNCKLKKSKATGKCIFSEIPEDEKQQLEQQVLNALDEKAIKCEVEKNIEEKQSKTIITEDGKVVELTTRKKTELVVEAKIIRDVNDVWGKGKGGFVCMPRVNRRAIRNALKDCKERDTMYYAIDILSENMSPNNFITDTVNNTYLNEHSDGYLSIPTLKRNKPLDRLVELDLIALNNKKQCMINPIVACAYTIDESNMNELARMYNEFKQDGHFKNPVYKGNIPEPDFKPTKGFHRSETK